MELVAQIVSVLNLVLASVFILLSVRQTGHEEIKSICIATLLFVTVLLLNQC